MFSRFKVFLKLFFLFTLFVISLEFLFWSFDYLQEQNISKHIYDYSGPFRKELDYTLGYSVIPNTEVNASLTVIANGEEHLCYEDITYQSDSKGRRISINQDFNSSKHALFFGCSFMFGVGLSNEHTLASKFQKHSANDFKSYNYGQSGHCAAQMLIKLRDPSMFDDIEKKNGCAIYLFINGHLKRSSGLYSFIKWYPWYPVFSIKKNELQGPFYWLSGNHPFKYKLKLRQLLDEYSHTGRYLNKHFLDTCLSHEESILTNIKIVEESYSLYKKLFPNNPFIVLNWTRSGAIGDERDFFEKEYSRRDIHFFTPEILPNMELSFIHKYDDHPSRHETDWIANQLHEFIEGLPHSK